MNTLHVLTIASLLSMCFSTRAEEEPKGSFWKFAGEYLLGKAVDGVWDTVTGKPDIRELEARVARLEQVAGESAQPVAQLRQSLHPDMLRSEYERIARIAIAELSSRLDIHEGRLDASEKRIATLEKTVFGNRPVSTLYSGSVGGLKATYILEWYDDGSVKGTYFYPSRGRQQLYDLRGHNPEDGKLYLEEFTNGILSARISLTKRVTENSILWEGAMHNTDGRHFRTIMTRCR